MPLAGTGCAIAPAMLAAIAAARGGDPFDATSLTEDYELCRDQDKPSPLLSTMSGLSRSDGSNTLSDEQ